MVNSRNIFPKTADINTHKNVEIFHHFYPSILSMKSEIIEKEFREKHWNVFNMKLVFERYVFWSFRLERIV